MAEKYLIAADEQKKQGSQQAVPGEKEIAGCVSSLIQLIHQVKAFVESGEVAGIRWYSTEREAITSLLMDTAFEPVLREQQQTRISYAATTAYDLLFRHRERNKARQ